MNFSLNDLPDSGPNPVVWMEIKLGHDIIGKFYIRLHRNVFPAGVENFVRIAGGRTYRTSRQGTATGRKRIRETTRTYNGNSFFAFKYNNYIVGGDIYNNNGTNAGTIFCDEPIPSSYIGNTFYPHDTKGLLSLVPFKNEETNEVFYDSTFLITLDNSKPTNVISDLDNDHVVIGQIYCSLDVLDKINLLLKPYAGRRYPKFTIANANITNGSRRQRPLLRKDINKYTVPCTCEQEHKCVCSKK
jgi:cyclophilin family peptidyl-prolyl cis-trans isomerase